MISFLCAHAFYLLALLKPRFRVSIVLITISDSFLVLIYSWLILISLFPFGWPIWYIYPSSAYNLFGWLADWALISILLLLLLLWPTFTSSLCSFSWDWCWAAWLKFCIIGNQSINTVESCRKGGMWCFWMKMNILCNKWSAKTVHWTQ